MRTGFLLLVFLASSAVNVLFCQTWEMEWDKQITTMSSISFKDVAEESGSGYAVLGSVGRKGALTADLWLLRYTMSGDTLWSKTFPAEGRDWPSRIVSIGGSGYLLAGIIEFPENRCRGILLRVNADGGERWKKMTEEPVVSLRCDVAADSTGRIWWLYTVRNESGLNELVLTCLGGDGETKASYTFREAGSLEGNAVRVLPDGSLAVCGQVEQGKPGFPGIWVTRINGSGETIWKTVIPSQGKKMWPECICCSADRNLLVTGWQGSCMNPDALPEDQIFDYDMILTKIDPAGKVLWTKNFNREGSEGGNALAPRPDGNILLAGKCASSYTGTIGPWLMLTDKTGKMVKEEVSKFRITGDEASRIINTSDGGFLVIGPGKVDPRQRISVGWIRKYQYKP